MSRSTDAFTGVPIDAVRHFWDERPCNLRHSPRELGTREYFDEVEARKYFVEPHIPPFADFERWRGRRVLEIGCGIGTDTVSFARAGAHVTAVDLSERSLELTRRRVRLFGVEDRVELHLANAEEIAEHVAPEPFDLIYSFGVIHHTPRPDLVLAGLRPFIGPQTRVKLMVYHRWSWKALWIVLTQGGRFWKAQETIARHSEAQSGCPVTYTFSRRGLVKLLGRYGLEVEDIFVDHIFPYRISDYVRYRYRKIWYFRVVPSPLFRAFERCFGWHLCVTARPVGARL